MKSMTAVVFFNTCLFNTSQSVGESVLRIAIHRGRNIARNEFRSMR